METIVTKIYMLHTKIAQSPKLQWTGIVIFVMSSFIYPSKSSSLKDFENFPLQERELLSIHKICLGNNTKPYERI